MAPFADTLPAPRARSQLRALVGAWPRAFLLAGQRAWFPAALLAAGLGVRAVQARGALLYPDGYQYLLMARGIGQHLRPVLQLGRGGELFVPNADAAMKPLFPALVALLHLTGASWTGAARLVSVAAGGASGALCGLVATRLASSRLLGAAAALLVLFDPLSRYWAAFSSPDELGQALMLGAVLALLCARPQLAGALAALAALARPELGLLLIAGAAVYLVSPSRRSAALGFLAAAFGTAALVLAVLRPPLDLRPAEVAVAIAGALAAAAVALLAPPRLGVAIGLVGLAVACLHGTALSHLVTHDLPVALPCAAGLVIARRRRAAAVVSVAACALAFAYDARNGASTRYVAQLLPLAAIGAAIGAGQARSLRLRGLAVGVGVTAVAFVAAAAAIPDPGPDMFGTIARGLPMTRRPIITAAADAYGFLLYPRPVRSLEVGSDGLLLLDATARAYEPWISAHGRLVAQLSPGDGFLAPDGGLDLAPARLILGTAARRVAPSAARSRPGGQVSGGGKR